MEENQKVRVKKTHPNIEKEFPLGFETRWYKTYTKEDRVSPAYSYKVGNIINHVREVVTPKGTFENLIFIGKNGGEYSSDWFYNCTGKYFTEFIEKI